MADKEHTLPTWETLSNVQVGDQIAFYPGSTLPMERYGHLVDADWRTVTGNRADGRSRIITFDDGSEFDAGHQYRLWVKR